jgi:hypothetical protein
MPLGTSCELVRADVMSMSGYEDCMCLQEISRIFVYVEVYLVQFFQDRMESSTQALVTRQVPQHTKIRFMIINSLTSQACQIYTMNA